MQIVMKAKLDYCCGGVGSVLSGFGSAGACGAACSFCPSAGADWPPNRFLIQSINPIVFLLMPNFLGL
jgi:hypothetical protein